MRGILGAVIALALLTTDAGAVFAQQNGDDRGWVRQFDSVTVEEIKPTDLPSTVRPGEQTVIRTESDKLPKPATREDLQKIVEHVDARVIQVVSVQTPPRPYRQVPMVHHGHALWVSAGSGKASVLISPLSWLKDADEVFVIPPKVAKDVDAEASWKGRKRSLASVTAGDRGKKWLEEHKKKLIAVKPHRPDKHRNLVTLLVDDSDAKGLTAPSSGLQLFDVENTALFRLYGYTPFFGDSLTQTTMLPTHPDDAALAFYWQTSYPAILGAPLVSQDGKLVAINTFRHPEKKKVFLAIPTGAISSYLASADDDEENRGDEKKDN